MCYVITHSPFRQLGPIVNVNFTLFDVGFDPKKKHPPVPNVLDKHQLGPAVVPVLKYIKPLHVDPDQYG